MTFRVAGRKGLSCNRPNQTNSGTTLGHDEICGSAQAPCSVKAVASQLKPGAGAIRALRKSPHRLVPGPLVPARMASPCQPAALPKGLIASRTYTAELGK